MPYGTGSFSYCAWMANVAFFFQFFNFFYNLHDLPQEKITRPYRKKNNSIFFYSFHNLTQKKVTHLLKKKLHDYTIFAYGIYIFHHSATLDVSLVQPVAHACPNMDRFASGWTQRTISGQPPVAAAAYYKVLFYHCWIAGPMHFTLAICVACREAYSNRNYLQAAGLSCTSGQSPYSTKCV